MNMHVNVSECSQLRVCVCAWRGIASQAIYYPTRRTVWQITRQLHVVVAVVFFFNNKFPPLTRGMTLTYPNSFAPG